MLEPDLYQRVQDIAPTLPMLQPVGDPKRPKENDHPVARSAESATLLITHGPNRGEQVALTGDRVTIGRNRHCDLTLDHVTVSRRHAEIRVDGERYTLVDAGSLNGTYHNRHPADTAELTDGDELRIGVYRLVFRNNLAGP